MKKRKRTKRSPKVKTNFSIFTLASIFIFTLLFWRYHTNLFSWVESKFSSHPPKQPPVALRENPKNLVTTNPQKETEPPREVKQTLIELFPSHAWEDDYLQTALPSPHQKTEIVTLGLAPSSVKPEKIRDPDQLHPFLLVVEKEKNGFSKKSEFSLNSSQSSISQLLPNSLVGIPRITSKSFFNWDEREEKGGIILLCDTDKKWQEAILFLHFQNGQISWIKAKEKSGNEKLALWTSGSGPAASHELQQSFESGTLELTEKSGTLDPQKPEAGLQWKTRKWRYENGLFVEQ